MLPLCQLWHTFTSNKALLQTMFQSIVSHEANVYIWPVDEKDLPNCTAIQQWMEQKVHCTKKRTSICWFLVGVPERGRTSDLQIRNLTLYPLSYGYLSFPVIPVQSTTCYKIQDFARVVKGFLANSPANSKNWSILIVRTCSLIH